MEYIANLKQLCIPLKTLKTSCYLALFTIPNVIQFTCTLPKCSPVPNAILCINQKKLFMLPFLYNNLTYLFKSWNLLQKIFFTLILLKGT